MTSCHVLETNILHARDVVYWLDGSTASDKADMERLNRPVSLTLTAAPGDLQVVHAVGRTALLRRPATSFVKEEATEIDKAFPASPVSFSIVGTVQDTAGRYNPRAFNLTVGGSGGASPAWYPAGQTVVMYPSPAGTSIGPAGGIVGNARWADSFTPVPWAMVVVGVTISLAETKRFTAQADKNGDFIVAFKGLPPLPTSSDYFDATLTLFASEAAVPDVPIDIDTLDAMDLGSLESVDTFLGSLSLHAIPGEVSVIRSFERNFLTVQPTSP